MLILNTTGNVVILFIYVFTGNELISSLLRVKWEHGCQLVICSLIVVFCYCWTEPWTHTHRQTDRQTDRLNCFGGWFAALAQKYNTQNKDNHRRSPHYHRSRRNTTAVSRATLKPAAGCSARRRSRGRCGAHREIRPAEFSQKLRRWNQRKAGGKVTCNMLILPAKTKIDKENLWL